MVLLDRSGWQGRRAFTLVEILTVVVIIGVLAALAIPRYRTATAESQLDGDANALFLGLEWAKLSANRTGVRHYVVIDTTNRAWNVYKEKNGDNLYGTSDSLISTDTLHTSIRFGHSGLTGIPLPAFAPDSLNVPSAGLADGYAGDDCIDGAIGTGQASWGKVITFCGGVVADAESGALYMSSTRSQKRLYAVAFNPKSSLALQRYRWFGSDNWERI